MIPWWCAVVVSPQRISCLSLLSPRTPFVAVFVAAPLCLFSLSLFLSSTNTFTPKVVLKEGDEGGEGRLVRKFLQDGDTVTMTGTCGGGAAHSLPSLLTVTFAFSLLSICFQVAFTCLVRWPEPQGVWQGLRICVLVVLRWFLFGLCQARACAFFLRSQAPTARPRGLASATSRARSSPPSPTCPSEKGAVKRSEVQ